ncbi:hypothetical protein CSV71_10515 [Sporosarcina sp. P21c]|nr:hypothetical protein CSV71_10515 [Sporosarcina sp. P21c]
MIRGVNLKKMILTILLLINIFYIANFLINFESFTLNILWLIFFIVSICVSLIFLFNSKVRSDYRPLILSVMVIVISIGSLGSYGFLYFITHLMG